MKLRVVERHCIFVDAGFLLCGAGSLCLGVEDLNKVEADYEGLIGTLKELAANYFQTPLLRLYWYDGAPGGTWTREHERIARVPDVKVRLGRVVRGQQKGVDSLLVRDLMTLSRNGAATDMLLVGGDEDLLVGMTEAQDQGVRVVIATLSSERTAASQLLVREADDKVLMTEQEIGPYVRRAPEAADVLERARAEGILFAEGWLVDASPEEIARAINSHPMIPHDLDAQLMATVEDELKVGRRDELRRAARNAFWSKVLSEPKNPVDPG